LRRVLLPIVTTLPSIENSQPFTRSKECAACLVTVTVYRVPQMRESGLRCVLVHMSRPLTKQMGCPVNGYENSHTVMAVPSMVK